MIRLVLPMPPSVWDIYEGYGKKRHVSSRYAKWRADAGWFIRGITASLRGPVSVDIAVMRSRANADLDNRAKAVCDCLQHYGVIENDKQIHRLTMQWHPGPEECVVIVQKHEEALAA